MKSDIEIAREIDLKPIHEIAQHLGLPSDELMPYGKYKAKVPAKLINPKPPETNLVLVTAITPTKAGIGKTTTSVGLSLGLEKLGKKTVVALREPSLWNERRGSWRRLCPSIAYGRHQSPFYWRLSRDYLRS